MSGEPVTVTLLDNPSALLIRNTKLSIWREWEAANNGMPGEVTVYRGYDLAKGSRFATITVRSTLPPRFTWGPQ